MDEKGIFRHELKYEISYLQYLELRSRLGGLMRQDTHIGPDGSYLVRSIYFDNYADKALREKKDGVPRREKFRIRYYNDDLSYMVLEKKTRQDYLGRKEDAVITEEECRRLLEGGVNWMRGHPSPLVRELYIKMRYQMLRPRVLVSYVREPYVYKAGNVRVTFDSHIRATLCRKAFLGEGDGIGGIGAAEGPGDMVMEVKYDAFLPEVVRNVIQTGMMRQQAFSKYEACRRFG